MNLSISNKTAYHLSEETLEKVANVAKEHINFSIDDLSLAILPPKQIQTVNRSYRGKDEPTDVLAFDYGEILLCPAYIKKKYQIKTTQEVIKKMGELFVHGLAHIAGYTHTTPQKEREMKEVEEKIVRRYYESNAKCKN